ncbi:sterile alpha motif domain-containing protein 5-like [Anneissia japonica]|uniref:sterile alpha motif domain-containing protein 5-like n=1 Tax=Anneissia japonica TaxID=1529436 RepID=UPI0014259CB4|nr:sterile alpha motif domain-containing protein 5-like [Anneissia japonica]
MEDSNIVEEWLRSLDLSQYLEAFIDNGYDDLETCKQIGEPDLDAIGVDATPHRVDILEAVNRLRTEGGAPVYFTLEPNPPSKDDADGNIVSETFFGDVGGGKYYGQVDEDVFTNSERACSHSETFVHYPKNQLKLMISQSLHERNINLSQQPFSNQDGRKSKTLQDH